MTLSGVVSQTEDPATAVEKIRQIEGVKDVDNKVQRVVRNYAV